jgi:hypothetical protein
MVKRISLDLLRRFAAPLDDGHYDSLFGHESAAKRIASSLLEK